MGGKKKLAAAQTKANQLAQKSLAQQRQQANKANRIANRSAAADRRQSAAQSAAALKAANANAAALAAATGDNPLPTEFIDDTSLTRRRLAMGGRSPYGFRSGGSGGGLGGAMTMLG